MDPLYRRTDVLGDGDQSWVELQDMLPNPLLKGADYTLSADMAVVSAARASYLGDNKGPEKDRKLLNYLIEHHHTTPFEQVEFKFRVRAPVVVWWQWVRHRTWHYNFQSGRYTEFEEDSFYIPAKWRLQSTDNKQGSDGQYDDEDGYYYSALREVAKAGFLYYQDALKDGIAKEQARFFLPAWCSYYIAVCKVDAWNLINFIRLRSDPHAQWEIRQYSNVLLHVIETFMPWTADAMRSVGLIRTE